MSYDPLLVNSKKIQKYHNNCMYIRVETQYHCFLYTTIIFISTIDFFSLLCSYTKVDSLVTFDDL